MTEIVLKDGTPVKKIVIHPDGGVIVPPDPDPDPDPPPQSGSYNPARDPDVEYQGMMPFHEGPRFSPLPDIVIPAGRYRRGATSFPFSKCLTWGFFLRGVPREKMVASVQKALGDRVRLRVVDADGEPVLGVESVTTMVGGLSVSTSPEPGVKVVPPGLYYLEIEAFTSIERKRFEQQTVIETTLSTLELLGP